MEIEYKKLVHVGFELETNRWWGFCHFTGHGNAGRKCSNVYLSATTMLVQHIKRAVPKRKQDKEHLKQSKIVK